MCAQEALRLLSNAQRAPLNQSLTFVVLCRYACQNLALNVCTHELFFFFTINVNFILPLSDLHKCLIAKHQILLHLALMPFTLTKNGCR